VRLDSRLCTLEFLAHRRFTQVQWPRQLLQSTLHEVRLSDASYIVERVSVTPFAFTAPFADGCTSQTLRKFDSDGDYHNKSLGWHQDPFDFLNELLRGSTQRRVVHHGLR